MKWETSIRPVIDVYTWHKHFTWKPIYKIDAETNQKKWAWLESIHRRSDSDGYWEYAFDEFELLKFIDEEKNNPSITCSNNIVSQNSTLSPYVTYVSGVSSYSCSPPPHVYMPASAAPRSRKGIQP